MKYKVWTSQSLYFLTVAEVRQVYDNNIRRFCAPYAMHHIFALPGPLHSLPLGKVFKEDSYPLWQGYTLLGIVHLLILPLRIKCNP